MKKMKFSLAALLLISIISCSGKEEETMPYFEIPKFEDKGWTFAATPSWSDEFDYEGMPNPDKWNYDIGRGANNDGWGNKELQYYTNSPNNVNVGNGKLTITAKKEAMGGANYTSTRLVSRGKGDFLYGRFEIKAKLPSGIGTWPAIWMLPTDWIYGAWPNSGEIDIMEHVGYDPNVVHISTHTLAYYFRINTQKTSKKTIPTATADFHVYRVDWTPYAIRGFIDNIQIFEFVNQNKGFAEWPFDKRFHLLMNVAAGGEWGAAQGMDENAFPASMEVDYVRVYNMIEK
ncbi:MAG: glycoside hydrolase family 16 protein [Sphingobacteriales bacterium]|nr:MAG: glycoside hydrolase family 16 protein [Sphingobacteriales bacterium]